MLSRYSGSRLNDWSKNFHVSKVKKLTKNKYKNRVNKNIILP